MFLISYLNAIIDFAGTLISAAIHGLVLWLAHATHGMEPQHAALIYGFTTGLVVGLPLGGMAILSGVKVGEAHYRSAVIIVAAVTLADFIVAASCMVTLHWFAIELPAWMRQVSAVVLVGVACKVWWDSKKENAMRDYGQEMLYFGMAFAATITHPGNWITYLAAYGVLLPSFGMLPLSQMPWGETFLQLMVNTLGMWSMWGLFLGIIVLMKVLRKHVAGLFTRPGPRKSSGYPWRVVVNRLTSLVMLAGAVALWNLHI